MTHIAKIAIIALPLISGTVAANALPGGPQDSETRSPTIGSQR